MKTRQNMSIYKFMFLRIVLFFTISCGKDGDSVSNTFTDQRDGKTYKTVTIGNQVWMAENLKYLPTVVGPGTASTTTPHYYVYDYDGTNVADAKATDNYSIYGVLYNWEAAKAACPSGWHLPSDEEWTQLTDHLGGSNVAGGKLKEADFTTWSGPNEGATNESGFTAVPGGLFFSTGGEFIYVWTGGYWWSSTGIDANSAWNRIMYFHNSNVGRLSNNKAFGLSVCCMKD